MLSLLKRGALIAALLGAIGASTSCMTTYDAYGRPVQSVDPGMAVAGAAAAGLVGYAIASNNHYYYPGGYYYGGWYHPHPYYPYYRGGYYAPHGYNYRSAPLNLHHSHY